METQLAHKQPESRFRTYLRQRTLSRAICAFPISEQVVTKRFTECNLPGTGSRAIQFQLFFETTVVRAGAEVV